jgi:hypothetical protein
MILSYTLLDDKGNKDYIVKPDLKPLYLCHDIKDSYDWFDLRVYDMIYVFEVWRIKTVLLEDRNSWI